MSGDRRIISHLLQLDLDALKKGSKPATGIVNALSGTTQSFCVCFVDQGMLPRVLPIKNSSQR